MGEAAHGCRGIGMHIVYCQKMIFPNGSAHAIHSGLTAVNFAAEGMPVSFFPGVSLCPGRRCLSEFFERLGIAVLPDALNLDLILTGHKGLYGMVFRYKLWRRAQLPQALCWASSVKEASLALALRPGGGERPPVVFEIHHLISRLKQGREAEHLYALEKKVFEQADMVVFNCDSLRQEAAGYLPEPKRALVSPLGFNERVIRPLRNPDVAEPSEIGKGVSLAYVGSVQPGKGLENLLQGIALLPERYSLTIVGGWQNERIQALGILAQELGLNGRVRFTGMVEQRRIGEILPDCDIFVIPIDTMADFHAPIKMYEALGFGLPIVATPTPSLSTMLEAGTNAVFAHGTDAQSLADAIFRLGEDPALRRAMRRNNVEVSRRFTSAHRAQTLTSLLREEFFQ